MKPQPSGWFSRLSSISGEPRFTRRPAKKRRKAKCFLQHLETRDLLSAVVVNTTNDTDAVAPATSPDDSSGNISLRSAIEYLDANGGGTIDFAASLYSSGPATITLGGTELAITQAMTITGPGASLMTIDANFKSRVFDIDDGNGTSDINVEIDGLTLTDGNADKGNGGAIYNAEILAMTNDTISGNTTNGGAGGGIYSSGTLSSAFDAISGNTANRGGGIYNFGTLTSTDDTISGNTAGFTGGGIYSQSEMISTNDTISGNSATYGGGIYNFGTLTTTNDTMSGNTAGFTGGGIDNIGTLNAINSIVAGNTTYGAPDLFGSLSASSAGNIIGLPVGHTLSQILATGTNGNPLLANNGGPTQTIALVPGSPAIGNAVALATLSAAVTDTASTSFSVNDATYLAVGDALKVDSEIVLVTAIDAANNTITVTRGADGTTAATHASATGLYLGLDQRGYLRVTNDIGAVEGPQQSIVVNTTADTHADGFTTLREAIAQANAEPWPGGTTITFASGLIGTITLTQGQLAITQSMTINGPGAGSLTISGGGNSRIFDVVGNPPIFYAGGGNDAAQISVVITDLTMADGNGSGGNGGAIVNAEILRLARDAIVGNVASEGGGEGFGGGAIFNIGTLTSTNDTISGNTASLPGAYGGGISNLGSLTSTNDSISGNNAAQGGALFDAGPLRLINDTISGNIAGLGGALFSNGIVVWTNDTIDANSATRGGAIFNDVAGTLFLTNDTIYGNTATAGAGGGIYNVGSLTSTNDTVSGNTAVGGAGGGIFYNKVNNNTLNLANTIVAGNTAPFDDDLSGKPTEDNGSNLIGLPADDTLSQVLATDGNGKPLLANNGGPTQTIALAPGSPAVGAAKPLATLNAAVTDATSASFNVNNATYLAVGDALKVDSEIVLVTAVDATDNTITVTRGADGTTAATHVSGADLFLAFDQRGLPRNANSDIGAFETQVPTVNITVQNASQVYNGAADPVSANVVGLSGAAIATSPAADIAFAYYAGTLTAGQIADAASLTGVPVNVGSYTVVANFNSDIAGYRDASSSPAYFTITPAALTYQIGNDVQSRGTAANLATDLPGTISTGINHETLTIAYSSTGDSASAPLGQYPITGEVSNGSGLAANYTVTLKPGTLTVDYPPGVGFLAGVPGDGTPQTFVRNLYRELLGREPSAGELAYWTAPVQADDSVAGREQIISSFMNSPEYKAHYVLTLYEVFLGRAPEAAALQYWSAKMGSPGTPGEHGGSAGEKFILAAIVGSDEFYDKAGGTDDGFVQALYRDLLGRDGEAAGVNAWASLVHNQEQSRDGIVRDFLGAPETEHSLLDGFNPLPGGAAASPLPAPGDSVPDQYDDLAIVTGLGWENLYLQGPYGNSPDGDDIFFAALAGGVQWDDVQNLLLASDQFYTNSNRPLT